MQGFSEQNLFTIGTLEGGEFLVDLMGSDSRETALETLFLQFELYDQRTHVRADKSMRHTWCKLFPGVVTGVDFSNNFSNPVSEMREHLEKAASHQGMEATSILLTTSNTRRPEPVD